MRATCTYRTNIVCTLIIKSMGGSSRGAPGGGSNPSEMAMTPPYQT